MKTLLVATTNPGKLSELQDFLSDLPITLVSLKDVGITAHVEETGTTFEENAILKAKYYCLTSGLPTLADDGGFEIDALHGEPGVKSHRWIHGTKDNEDEELISYTIRRLQGIPKSERGAQLHLVLAFAIPTGEIKTSEGLVRGVIPLVPSNNRWKGFPYRSLLFLPEIKKFYNHFELTEEENRTYNHRRKAIEDLKPIIREVLC
jgi:XTP/dITP diphosphohydrolase